MCLRQETTSVFSTTETTKINLATHSTIKPAMEPRASNSYDFVRFCAASAVLVSHHFALSQLPEPLVPGYGDNLGVLGVQVFFCLSGFLICRSLQKSTDWALFASARFLRIFPNLTFSLTATSVATLLWYSNYSHIGKHIKFVVGNLLMFFRGVTYIIPGVFEDAKASPAINGPLWSLPFELWLYVLLFLFFLVGGRRISLWVLAGAVVLSVVWGATPTIGDITIGPFDSFQFSRLGSFFLSGALLAFWWPSIENHAVTIGAAALLATFLIHYLLPINTIFHSLAVAATVVGLGNSKSMAWFSRGGRCIVRDVHFCVATTTIFLVASWLVLVVHDRGILSHDGTRICDVAHF